MTRLHVRILINVISGRHFDRRRGGRLSPLVRPEVDSVLLEILVNLDESFLVRFGEEDQHEDDGRQGYAGEQPLDSIRSAEKVWKFPGKKIYVNFLGKSAV